MKRKSQILILLLASLMTAYLGAGQLVMQCRHTGLVELVMHGKKNCCHKQKSNCMTLEMKKLQPSTLSVHHAQTDAPVAVVPPTAMPADNWLAFVSPNWQPVCRRAVESPPRRRLSMICTLLI